ncbi:ATP-dependent DNA helicase, Rep family [[Leptolyngbya] sp. PCC 7376]|uniref:DNA helicase PcrA n=1 Tax=[Leptolyngbya] sp. PCC 7376 TaxID=111781 RepID=UPI00029F0BAD|nr:DNA helicase PcrA [[Leptolyngbya] sp. PCC 7376]AFY37656.1 ATP-dependent DNA helicase, Rep family [[Leptolyngbya] sp. PCC 7376]
MSDLLAQLNPSQRRAVEHFCGPLLVVAGAGSGKTRALTFRIANLIRQHRVDPENILAVTFTNKAAREMKERVELLYAQQLAELHHNKPFSALPEFEQKKLRSQVYKQVTKHLWIGTFHSLCCRILRFDINKYQDEKGRTWKRNFTIFDDSDVQTIIKKIVTQQLNLDDKKFNPRNIRYQISNAKNLGLSPNDYMRSEGGGYKAKIVAEVYEAYQNSLAANNALDFDDLILIPVRLFQQNESILGYWHSQFHHILVDEYQDTNRIQYDLIRMLSTNNETDRSAWTWKNRSLFAVGDADQSIYSFRMADYTILLEFQENFGDGLPDEDTRTMVKLEENYRSRENILKAANALIEQNSQRIDKVLRATRGAGEEIYCHKADNENDEARFVLAQMMGLRRNNPELDWGDFAILYRTNAQSRPLEELLNSRNIPYQVVGGFKFYDRQEIKDALAYLKIVENSFDSVSLTRVINTPKRGIGKTTVDRLSSVAQELGCSLWEIISDETSVATIAGRAAKKINQFATLIKEMQEHKTELSAAQILDSLMKDSGYINALQQKGTDEADSRIENIGQLYNKAISIAEENENDSLEVFLADASLNTDSDNNDENTQKVSLMSLHAAKGLEFPVVFLVGLEQKLLPHQRSLNDPVALEEERRLCYVGITRAQEQLFLSYVRERFMWGYREPAVASQFLAELPKDLVVSNVRSLQKEAPSQEPKTMSISQKQRSQKRRERQTARVQITQQKWEVGDRVNHNTFGEGEVTHIFGDGKKTNLAILFPNLGKKIIDPRVAPMKKI